MALNGSVSAVIAERRAAVARLRVRGLTQREIVDALAKEGVINRANSKPWALGTINGDVKALEEQWRDEAADEIALHKGRQFARLEMHYREAVARGDLREVRENIKTMMALLGTEAPKRQEVRATVTTTNEYDGMTDDDLRRELEAVGRRYAAIGADDSGSPEDEGLDEGADSPGESTGDIDT